MAFRSGSLRAVSFGNVLLPRDIFMQVHTSAAWIFLPVPYRLQLAVLCQRQFIALRAPLSPPHFPFYPFHCPTSLRYGVQVLSISLSLLVWVLVYCVLFFSHEVDRNSFKICRRLLLINSSSFIVITLFRPTPYIHSNRSAISLAYAVRCVTYMYLCLCVCVTFVCCD